MTHAATEATPFGGTWTVDKLDCLANYLKAYTNIFHSNSAARYFTTFYVDAFAGTGYVKTRTRRREHLTLFGRESSHDAQEYLQGSVIRALQTEPRFHKYLFVERDAGRCAELSSICSHFPDRAPDVRIEHAEANQFLQRWICQTNWRKCRAVLFLDPYAMQVKWNLIEQIASTAAIDLWLLFPYMAFNRLLTTRNKPRPSWAKKLTDICGTSAWESEFYRTEQVQTLFGPSETNKKEAGVDRIGRFILKRLQAARFARVASEPLILRNSRGPLFLLFFAAGNPKGAPTAVRIADSIIGKKRGR